MRLRRPSDRLAGERTKIVATYGKTWHTWHTDQGKQLPIGVPELMMGFVEDGQAD